MASEDDEDAIRKAFEQFMLSGSNSTKKNKEKNNLSSDDRNVTFSPNKMKTPPPRAKERESPSRLLHQKYSPARIEKKYWHVFKRFCSTVRKDWIDVDDQLEDVVHSVMNLRLRIPLEHKFLAKLEKGQHTTDTAVAMFLTIDDVNLALSHDLLQHEKMIAALRRLLSDVSKTHEYLGRQLDDAMHFHLYFSSSCETDSCASSSATALIDDMNRMYSMLSEELYRKQLLAITLTESSNDSLFLISTDEIEDYDKSDDTPRGINASSHVVKEWPRNSKKSCIDTTYFEQVMSKCTS